MRSKIDSKVLKAMDLAIKYIGKLTEEDLDKLINGTSTFLVSDKHRNKAVKEAVTEYDWTIEIEKLKEFNNSRNQVETSGFNLQKSVWNGLQYAWNQSLKVI